MKPYDYEEEFHARDRKQARKERKIAQKSDRSQFKKSDLDKRAKQERGGEHLNRGRVIAIGGEGAWVDHEGKKYLCSLKGVLKKKTTQVKNLIAVGDWVSLSLLTETEGAIEGVEERTSSLTRTDISGKKEQLIAANVDQVAIVASIVEPPLKPSLVDRYLIAAEKGNLHPIIVINKVDLIETASQEDKKLYRDFLSAYELLGYPILSLSATTGIGIEALRSLLQNKTSVFSGQSGVGKSSLLNVCFGWNLKVGELAQKTYKGTHTTTTAELISLPGGGYCVDTPGIRSFGLWKLQKEDISAHFRDIASFAIGCKFPDCTHRNEPECAVQEALAKGNLAPLRYESYRNLLEEVLGGLDKMTWS